MAARKKDTRSPGTRVKEAPKIEPKVQFEKTKKTFYKKPFFYLLALLILLGVAYLGRGLFVAAVVDGKPIWRIKIIRNLEKRQGKDVLDSLITERLVINEAKKQGVEVSDDEVNTKIKDLEDSISSQGQDLDTLLASEGVSRTELEEQVRLQAMIEKLLQKQITISDDEIDSYIKTNKDTYLKDVADADLRDTARTQLMQQKMSEQFQTWIDGLKSKANIHYWVAY